MFKKMVTRRLIMVIVALFMFLAYQLLTDPDVGLIENLPFGYVLVYSIQVIFWITLIISIIEYVPDLIFDNSIRNDKELVDMAKSTPEGSGKVLIADSIRILAYATIAAAVLIMVLGRTQMVG